MPSHGVMKPRAWDYSVPGTEVPMGPQCPGHAQDHSEDTIAPSPSTAHHPACLHRVQWGTLLQAWGCCLVTKSHYQLHLMTHLLLQHCLCRGKCSSCLRACQEMGMGL